MRNYETLARCSILLYSYPMTVTSTTVCVRECVLKVLKHFSLYSYIVNPPQKKT